MPVEPEIAHPQCSATPSRQRLGRAGTLETSRGLTSWTVTAELVDTLLDTDGIRLSEWQAVDQLAVIKSGPHRSVYRLDLAAGCFYLKHYKINDWRALARNLLRPCKAILESRAAERVSAAGIETFETIAVGCTKSRGIALDSFLITRSIDDAQTLHDFVLSPAGAESLRRNPTLRQRLAERLGDLTAKLHRGSLVHNDFHPGNILIGMDSPLEPRLWLVDLHAVVRARKLSLRSIEQNLSLLNTFFARFSTPSDRLRYFQAYWRGLGRTMAGKDFAATVRRVESFCRNVLDETHRKGDRKWLRANRRIVIEEQGARCGRGVVEFGRSSIAEFCNDAERLFERGHVRFWRRRTPRARLAAVDLQTESGHWECYIRSEANPRSSAGLSILRRWSSIRRAWEMGHSFRRRGLNTPLPLYYGETRSLAAIREYLVTERIANVLPLSTFLEHTLAGAGSVPRESWLRQAAGRIALQIRRMHDCLFDHAALSADNLLVASSMNVRDAWFLGLDQVQSRTRLAHSHVVSNLAEFNNSLIDARFVRLTHRLRFLKAYLGRRNEAAWKTLWRAVAKLATKRPVVEVDAVASRRAFLAASIGLCATLSSGCHMLNRSEQPKPAVLPASHSVRADQLLVLSDMKLQKDHPLIVDLTNLRKDVAKSLQLPLEKNPVIVYLFSNEKEYRAYLNATYPKLPPRRAYFVGTSTELAVYTFWGDNIQEDLRHEYTHGLLHSCMKQVPLWIDEGLAEYFEVITKDPARLNSDYAQRLGTSLVNGWRPDMRRLERIDEFAKLQQLDYQESWAWVHYMLHSTPDTRQTLVEYLNDLRSDPHPTPLSDRLAQQIPDVDARFLAYLGSMPQSRHVAGVL